jgi:small GTP-binding protein
VRLADTVDRWLGRVEVVLGGAEVPLREGEEALELGDSARARAAAHEILARVPGSPLGLALLADACEMAGLEAEYAMALEELAERAPSRADVWVRLGRARAATKAPGGDVRDAYVRALAVAEPGEAARREALLALADLDLAQNEPERADLWLERVAEDRAPEVALRRAEVRLARGDAEGALAELGQVKIEALDGRANLALGRGKTMRGDPAGLGPLIRAAIVDQPGASEALSSALGWLPSDEATRAKIRLLVEERGEAGLARWRASFARAEGKRDEARAALVEAVRAGKKEAARPLLDAALEDRDEEALRAAVDALVGHGASAATADPVLRDAERLSAWLRPGALDEAVSRDGTLLDDLASLSTPRAIGWGGELRRAVARARIPASGPARWDLLLGRLEAIARSVHDVESSARIAGLSAERRRPLRLAVVGEFNAGKSTFINALVGQEIAPTGVLPTTATLHHLRYAPDPIARILFQPGADASHRIVAVGDLRATLKSIEATSIRRVEILLPIASLTRVEILDTPGFNAPDARHTEVARRAFEEADAAIWLLDAGQPMKRTEREIFEEARAARLPMQVLVNKADRLTPAEGERVLAAVEEGLAGGALASWSPPLLFSARKALLGKLGDAAALAASGWPGVEAMLESQFVARSDELKERALRRRALAIVATLGRTAAHAADEERALEETSRKRSLARSQAAARIDRQSEAVAAAIAESLGPAKAAWEREMALVVAGRDRAALARDASLVRYSIDRALAHLARPLAQALAGAADGSGVPPADLAPLTRATIRAFASVAAEGAPVLPLARSAVASLVEHLVSAAAIPPAPPRAAGLVGELTALAEALG